MRQNYKREKWMDTCPPPRIWDGDKCYQSCQEMSLALLKKVAAALEIDVAREKNISSGWKKDEKSWYCSLVTGTLRRLEERSLYWVDDGSDQEEMAGSDDEMSTSATTDEEGPATTTASTRRPGVVFDFDQTLSQEHLWQALYGKGAPPAFRGRSREENLADPRFVVDYIFGGADRVSALARNLGNTRQMADLFISSHGYVDDIVAALETLAAAGFNVSPATFTLIHGKQRIPGGSYSRAPFVYVSPSAPLSPTEVGNKLAFITEVVQPEYSSNCIAFIDDDEPKQYYDDLQRFGVRTIPMDRGSKGVGRRDFTALWKAIDDCK